MTPASQFTFIYRLPSGRSRRAHDLQRSQARSHAAVVTHRRRKSRGNPKLEGPSAQPPTHGGGRAVVPFHTLRLSSPPSTLGDRSYHISSANSSTGAIFPAQGPLGQPQPSYAVNDYLFQDPSLALASSQASTCTTPPSSPILLVHDGFTGLRTDPFSCIPTGGDSRIESAIDFISQVIGFGNDTVCYVFDVSNVYVSFLETLQDECFFDAGLGVVQFLLEQIRNPGSQPSAQTLNHRGKAIGKILNKISNHDSPVDDVTIFGMIFLAALEKGLRNPEAHHLHKRNIAQIISQRGGLKALQDGSMLKGYLTHYDTFWAVETGKTMFPGQRRRFERRYPSHPFSVELWTSITKLPEGFQKLATECTLCLDILPILARAAYITRLSPTIRSEFISKTRRAPKGYDDFWDACPYLALSDNSCPVLEQLLSLTLICYSFTAFGSNYYPTAFRASRLGITRKIVSYYPKSRAEEHCLIWMWVIAIDSWRIGSRLQPDGLSLLFNLQTRFPALRRMSAVNDIASRFFWPRDLSKPGYLYWEDLVGTG